MSVVYRINGKVVTRREFFRGKRIGGSGVAMGVQAYSDSKPLKSLALSCHRDRAAEHNAEAQRRGLTGIKWDEAGNCEITSGRDRAAWLRSQQQHDEDAYYTG